MGTAFDHALELRELGAAAEAYASGHGKPGTAAYRAAWLRYRAETRAPDAQPSWQPPPWSLNRDCVRLLNLALKRAMLIDGAPMANAQIVDGEHKALRIVAHAGLNSEFLEFFQVVDHGSRASCGDALAMNRSLWVEDTIGSPIFAGSLALEVLLDAGSRRCSSVPVRSPSGQVIAMINTHHNRTACWNDRQKLGLEVLASTTGKLLHALMRDARSGPNDTP